MINIIFMGTPSYATTILEELLKHDNINVQAIFTQPDKPVGRKKILTYPHIKQYIHDNNIDITLYQPQKLNTIDNELIIKELNPDFIIVAAYGQIVPKSILDMSECINLHASILPKYRGASPIQDSILKNDKFTGVTAMKMDVGLDTGDILALSYVQIEDDLVVYKLFDILASSASKLTIEVINRYKSLKAYPQDSSSASSCSKIKKQDGEIVFDNANNIYQKYKAYKNWPDIFLENGLKIKEIRLYSKNTTYPKGIILEILDNSIVVGCLVGSLEILEVQPPSKKSMNVIDYIRGKRLEIGDTLS